MRKLYSPDKTEIVGILVTTIGTYTIENVRDEGGVVEYDDPREYTPVSVEYGEPTDEYINAYTNQRVFVDENGDHYNEYELIYEDGTIVGEELEEEEAYA